MGVAVDGEQPIDVDVGVALGGRERGVPEQLLDRPQVGALLEQVGGEGVPQRVRVNAAGTRRGVDPVVENAPHRAIAQAAASAIAEDRAGIVERARRQLARRDPPALERRRRGAPERHLALLVPLADDAQRALTELDVGSDPARMTTTATPTPDGSAYLIDGEKLWCTNGSIAELKIGRAHV